MDIEIKVIPTGPLQVNTVIVKNPERKELFLVDPGGDEALLLEEIGDFQLVEIVHTHGHFDHIWGTHAILESREPGQEKIPLSLHQADQFLWSNMAMQASGFGIDLECTLPDTDIELTDGQEREIAGVKITFLHTPGHSPGSVCLYLKEQSLLICGDLIFQSSIGRTDLWGGNFDQLIDSIKTKVLTLPPQTRIIPGHGPETTVAREIEQNPFLSSEEI